MIQYVCRRLEALERDSGVRAGRQEIGQSSREGDQGTDAGSWHQGILLYPGNRTRVEEEH